MACRVQTLLAAAAVTTTQTGSAVSLAKYSKPITNENDGFNRSLSVAVDCTVTAGGGSVLHTVQGKFGSTWIALTPLTAHTTASTVADGSGFRTYLGPVPLEIRSLATVTGSVTFSSTVTAIGID